MASSSISQVYRLGLFKFTRNPSDILQRSLGASGGVLSLISLYAHKHPEHEVTLFFLPYPFPVSTAVQGLVAFDSLALLFSGLWMDHAAHLGGILFGWLYAKYGVPLWDRRDKILDSLLASPQKEKK